MAGVGVETQESSTSASDVQVGGFVRELLSSWALDYSGSPKEYLNTRKIFTTEYSGRIINEPPSLVSKQEHNGVLILSRFITPIKRRVREVPGKIYMFRLGENNSNRYLGQVAFEAGQYDQILESITNGTFQYGEIPQELLLSELYTLSAILLDKNKRPT